MTTVLPRGLWGFWSLQVTELISVPTLFPQSPWKPGRPPSLVHRRAPWQNIHDHRPQGLKGSGQEQSRCETVHSGNCQTTDAHTPAQPNPDLGKEVPWWDGSEPGRAAGSRAKPRNAHGGPYAAPGTNSSPGRREPGSPRSVCHLVVAALRNQRTHWAQARAWSLDVPQMSASVPKQWQCLRLKAEQTQAHQARLLPGVWGPELNCCQLELADHTSGE